MSPTDFEWLQGALAPLGQVVSAGGGSLDELLALVDVTFASLVFVGLDREHVVAQSALIEGALEAKPMLARSNHVTARDIGAQGPKELSDVPQTVCENSRVF